MRHLFLAVALLWPVVATANFDAGVQAYLRGDYEQAVGEFRQAAQAGHAEARTWLGFMYESGQGVPENDAEALKWYRMAAGQGQVVAQFNLAQMYRKGDGLPVDDGEALKWYSTAALQGHGDAQHNLGLMYAGGRGTEQDALRAYAWLSLAAALGARGADRSRDFVREKLTAEQVVEAQELTRELCTQVSGCKR